MVYDKDAPVIHSSALLREQLFSFNSSSSNSSLTWNPIFAYLSE